MIAALLTTIVFSLGATVATLLASFALGWMLNRFAASPGVLSGFESFWMLPGTLIAMSILVLRLQLEARGWQIPSGVGLMIAGAVWGGAPFWAVRWVQVARDVPGELREWAATAGVSEFWNLEWPAIRNRLPGAIALLVLWSSTAFSIVYFLGGGPPIETLETRAVVRLLGWGNSGAETIALVALLLLWLLPFTWIQRSVIWEGVSPQKAFRVDPRLSFVGVILLGIWLLPLGLGMWAGFGELPGVLQDHGPELSAALMESGLDVVGVVGIGFICIATSLFGLSELSKSRGNRFERGIAILSWLPLIAWVLIVHRCVQSGSISLRVARWCVWIVPWSALSVRLLRSGQTVDLKALLEWGQTAGLSRLQRFQRIAWPHWRWRIATQMVWMSVWAVTESMSNWIFADPEHPNLMALQMEWLGRYRMQEAQALTALWISGAGMLLLLLRGFARKQT